MLRRTASACLLRARVAKVAGLIAPPDLAPVANRKPDSDAPPQQAGE
jgi:hypothetical protein